MSSVGFTARKIDPVQELRVAYQNLTDIQKNIQAIRQSLKAGNFRKLDTELVAAWLSTVEAEQQIEAVGKAIKSPTNAEDLPLEAHV
jgi:hypothetical protein